jgi:hypothetical protein
MKNYSLNFTKIFPSSLFCTNNKYIGTLCHNSKSVGTLYLMRFTHTSKGVFSFSRLTSGLTNGFSRSPSCAAISPTVKAPVSSVAIPSGSRYSEVSNNPWNLVNRSLTTMAKSSISRFPNDVRAYDHFLRDDTAYQVLLTLANTPSHSKDDNAVIQALLFLFLRNKNFNNRYFQVSMESLFQSKHFDLQAALEAVPEDFTLLDIFNLNGNKVHQSTLFTVFQCHQLADQPGFSNKIEAKVIIQTPLKQFDPKTVNSVLHKFIMNSQRSTGNTSCDLQLNNHPYDYKFSMDDKVLLARNVIVPIQVYHENAINRFIFLWLKHMDNISEINNSLNTDSLLYYKNLFEKVKTIDENKSLNVKEKLLAINKITFKDLDSRPSDCFIPIVLPVGDPSHVPNILVSEKLNLPPTKDTISNVLDKRYNFIITTLEQQSREYLYLRTNGVFGSSSPSSLDEFDSISSS